MVAVLWGGGELLVNRAIEAAAASRHESRRYLYHVRWLWLAPWWALCAARGSQDEDAGDEDL